MTKSSLASRSQIGRRVAIGLLAIAPAIALAACSSSSGSTKSGNNSSASASVDTSQFPGKAATGSEVKIGLINDEGGTAIDQPENRVAAEAAVKYANENLGGLATHKITLVECKQQEDAASATACANQMVQAGVSAVVVTTTGQGDAMAPIITKAGIPYVSVSGAAASELTSKNAYMWTGGFPGTLAAMAKYSAGKGYKDVTAYVTNNAAAIGGAQQLGTPTFKAAGIKLNVVAIPNGDATSQVSSGLSTKPGAVIVVGDANTCTSVLSALGTLQATAEKLIIQPCLDPSTIKAVGSGMDGAKVFTVADTVSDHPETALFKAVMAKYAPGTSTAGYAVVGYQGVLGLVRATTGLTGDPTPAAVSAAIAASKDAVLPAGHGITYTCNGKAFPGLTAVCSTGEVVLTVKNGVGTDPQLVS